MFNKKNKIKQNYIFSLRNAQSPLEQIVRSEAEISTVSFGADRSEQSVDKKGKIFWHGQIFEQKNLQIVPFGKEYARKKNKILKIKQNYFSLSKKILKNLGNLVHNKRTKLSKIIFFLWNAQSPLEQIVRSEAKIRKGRIFYITK